MSEIKAILEELKNTAIELKEVNKHARELRARKKELEADVIKFLEDNEQPGLRFANVVFISSEKKKRAYKKKADKIGDASAVLDKYGVKDSKKVLEEVLEATRGAVSQIPALKIKEMAAFEDL